MKTLKTIVITLVLLMLPVLTTVQAEPPAADNPPAPKLDDAQQPQDEHADMTWWLNKALACAEEIKNIEQKETALAAIAEIQAHAGMFKEAAENAKSITTMDKKAMLLRVIAEQQARDNKPDDAKKTFSEALALARQFEIVINLCLTGQAQAHAGFKEDAAKTFAEAEAIGEKADSKIGKNYAFSIAAQYLAWSGMFKEALEAAEQIENPTNKWFAFYCIATEEARNGQFAEALATIGTSDPRSTEEVLYIIADMQSKSGDIHGARRTLFDARSVAKKLPDSIVKVIKYCEIAEAQIKINDRQAALETIIQALLCQDRVLQNNREEVLARAEEFAKQVNAEHPQKEERAKHTWGEDWQETMPISTGAVDLALSYSLIAQTLAIAGETKDADATFKQAVNMAAELKTPNEKMYTLEAIAADMTRAGMFAEALTTVHLIEDVTRRYWPLEFIATTEAEHGLVEQALDTAKTIKDPYYMSSAFASIALEEAKKGNTESAIELASDAMNTARVIPDLENRSSVFRMIAAAQVEAGSETVPAETMNTLRDEPGITRCWYCIGVLRAMAAKMHPGENIRWLFWGY